MDREKNRFSKLWNVDITRDPTHEVAADISSSSFKACPMDTPYDWNTQTEFHFLSLDDVVLSEFARPNASRLWRYLHTFWDYMLSGTAFKFIKHSWRFSIYFFYPATMFLLTLLLCAWLAVVIRQSSIEWSNSIAVFVFFTVFATVLKLGGKKYHILHLMDLWNFSRDFLHNDQSEIGPKLDRFAAQIRGTIAKGNHDEILLIGHSTGGALILDAAGRAFEQDPHFLDHDCDVTIMTIGSTALKIGLHPSAQWFRNRLNRLFTKTNVRWVEYQCLTDLINFHRTNPAHLMGLESAINQPPKIHDIRIKHMIDAATYKRIKRNFFRVHYQFVYGNTQSHHYDFFAICFGPVALWHRAHNHHSYRASFLTPPAVQGPLPEVDA